jgi:hypothetical protein
VVAQPCRDRDVRLGQRDRPGEQRQQYQPEREVGAEPLPRGWPRRPTAASALPQERRRDRRAAAGATAAGTTAPAAPIQAPRQQAERGGEPHTTTPSPRRSVSSRSATSVSSSSGRRRGRANPHVAVTSASQASRVAGVGVQGRLVDADLDLVPVSASTSRRSPRTVGSRSSRPSTCTSRPSPRPAASVRSVALPALEQQVADEHDRPARPLPVGLAQRRGEVGATRRGVVVRRAGWSAGAAGARPPPAWPGPGTTVRHRRSRGARRPPRGRPRAVPARGPGRPPPVRRTRRRPAAPPAALRPNPIDADRSTTTRTAASSSASYSFTSRRPSRREALRSMRPRVVAGTYSRSSAKSRLDPSRATGATPA